MYRNFVFRLIFARIDPERAHQLAVALMRFAAATPARWLIRRFTAPAPTAGVTAMGIDFPAPFGLAAGFDKDAVAIKALSMLGFGFVEVGTLTPRPQPGNDRPRLWRRPAEASLINRMGFNNQGAAAAAVRLRRLRKQRFGRDLIVGVNIGKNKDTPERDAVDDYVTATRLLAPYADYLVVNVSSPNTPGLRDLQSVAVLRPLLSAVQAALQSAVPDRNVPLLVKIAPDLADEDIDDVADLVRDLNLAGVVAVNTTIAHDHGVGGLSGLPLLPRGLAVVKRLRHRLGQQATIIGVGGVTTSSDAQEYLSAGANLVQGYTGFIYEGPFWAGRINRHLQPASHGND